MWCHQCREDVPALPSSDKPGVCCARCGATIQSEFFGAAASDPAISYDGWELDEQLRHIERILKPEGFLGGLAANLQDGLPEPARFDLAHAAADAGRVPSPHVGLTKRHQPSRKRRTQRGTFWGAFTWMGLSLGTAAFACGGILLGWSMAAGRQELWNIGLPVALGGQIALMVGLV